jgi:thiamine-phosphate pyrophosphorylase
MNTQTIAEQIALNHAHMQAGGALAYASVVTANDQSLPSEQAGVLQGCRMLGFLEHDAQCVANAWHAQTMRTRSFSIETWPTYAIDFGITDWPRKNVFPECPKSLGLYAVLPDAKWIKRMAAVGVPTLQLRFKSNDDVAIRREVRAAIEAVKGTKSLLFINDYWQIAIEEGAYGVHLGQEDMEIAPMETLKQSGLRLGLSTHGYAEMIRAQAYSPSYLALGAVFPTTLKRMQTAPQGLGRLYAYAKLMKEQSLVAIGGIDSERVPQVMQSGVGSIAMVRAIIASDDPEKSAVDLMKLMKRP